MWHRMLMSTECFIYINCLVCFWNVCFTHSLFSFSFFLSLFLSLVFLFYYQTAYFPSLSISLALSLPPSLALSWAPTIKVSEYRHEKDAFNPCLFQILLPQPLTSCLSLLPAPSILLFPLPFKSNPSPQVVVFCPLFCVPGIFSSQCIYPSALIIDSLITLTLWCFFSPLLMNKSSIMKLYFYEEVFHLSSFLTFFTFILLLFLCSAFYLSHICLHYRKSWYLGHQKTDV